jgi:dTMP kinase
MYDFPRYDNDASVLVKRYLNGEYGNQLGPKASSLFYAMDRFDASIGLKKDIETYDFIISNRYTTSNMVHQGGKIDDKNELVEYLTWLEDLEYTILGIPKPDKVIFLSLAIETAIKLIEKKQQRAYIKQGNKDIHEADDNHLKNAYNSAVRVALLMGWTTVECEENGALLPPLAITQKIL